MHLALFLLVFAQQHPAGPFEDEAVMAAAPATADDSADAENDDDGDDAEEAESESAQPGDATAPGIHYTADLSDSELQRRWTDDLASLGSISVGFADQGRLINGAYMGNDPAWLLERPN